MTIIGQILKLENLIKTFMDKNFNHHKAYQNIEYHKGDMNKIVFKIITDNFDQIKFENDSKLSIQYLEVDEFLIEGLKYLWNIWEIKCTYTISTQFLNLTLNLLDCYKQSKEIHELISSVLRYGNYREETTDIFKERFITKMLNMILDKPGWKIFGFNLLCILENLF